MPFPTRIELHSKSATLEIAFDSGDEYIFTAEFLRVFSPSAEVRGHGGKGAVLQTGKRQVGIQNIAAVGRYALKITFSDGHDSGLYSWEYLMDLGRHQDHYWEGYLAQLAEAGASRDKTFP